MGAKDTVQTTVRGCRRGGRDVWGRVRGMSGRGYGDYFSTIRSMQTQTGGERGLHGACSVGLYLGYK